MSWPAGRLIDWINSFDPRSVKRRVIMEGFFQHQMVQSRVCFQCSLFRLGRATREPANTAATDKESSKAQPLRHTR